ncbi:MAG: hypothetical protein ACM3TT_04865 [Syntrophothermus sp.]
MNRKVLYTLGCLLLFLALFAGPTAAGAESNFYSDSDSGDVDYKYSGSGKKDPGTVPVLGYNPLDGWYLGATFSREFDDEGTQLKLLGRYGLLSKKLSGLISYDKAFGRLSLGVSGWDMVTYRGIYEEEPLWEYSTSASVNLRYHWDEARVRLGLSEKEFSQALYGGPRAFDKGQTLISDLLVGWTRPGFSAYTKWNHGFPVRESRYEYDSFQLTGVKVLPVGEDSNFTVSARGAAINGVYPRQDGLFLGDERYSFDGHFLDRLIGLGEAQHYYTLPDEDFTGYFLRGYPDKAFAGDRMYVVNLEYGKTLLPGFFDPERFQFEAVTFLDIGNAWFESAGAPGEAKMGGGIGLKAHIGLDEDSVYGRRLLRPGIVLSADLARGILKQGLWRFGFSAGVSHRF